MKKILIVDDEQDIVESLKFVLEVSGYTCYCAYNGEDGLKLAKEIEKQARGKSTSPSSTTKVKVEKSVLDMTDEEFLEKERNESADYF